MVPDSVPPPSLWSRLVHRITGTPAVDPGDDRTAIPAVDPWADQDTPAWPDAFITPPADPSRFELPTPAPTRLDNPPAVPAPQEPSAPADRRPPAAPAGQKSPAAPAKPRSWGERAPSGVPGKRRPWNRRRTPPAAPHRLPVQARPPAAPPPAARPPVPPPVPPPAARPPVPTPRRKPRRLRKFTRFTVIALVLFCGVPFAYRLLPGGRQYPVTAVLPDSFADLKRRDTAAAERAAKRLAEQLQAAGSDGEAFAGVYADGRGKRVTVFGATGLRLTPGSDVQAQLDRLAEALALKNIQSFDTGEFGAHQQCGSGRLDGTSVVACTWADHGSLATVVLTRRSVQESAALVAGLRTTILEPA